MVDKESFVVDAGISGAGNESTDGSEFVHAQPTAPAAGAPYEPGRAEVEVGDQPSTEPAEERLAEAEEEGGKFFVVGIGASAGGLEALGELIKYVPLDRM